MFICRIKTAQIPRFVCFEMSLIPFFRTILYQNVKDVGFILTIMVNVLYLTHSI